MALINLLLRPCLYFKVGKIGSHMEERLLTAALLEKYLYEPEHAKSLLKEVHARAKEIARDTRRSVRQLLSAAAQKIGCVPIQGLKYSRENLQRKLELAMRTAVSVRSVARSQRKSLTVYTGRGRLPSSPFDKKVGGGKHRKKKSLGG